MANAGDIRMGGAYVELGVDPKPLENGLKQAEKKVADSATKTGRKWSDVFSMSIKEIASNKWVAATTGAVGSAVAIGAKASETYKNLGKEIGSASRMTGFSTETLSKLRVAFGGLESMPVLTKGMATFMLQLQSGSSEMTNVAQQLGVSFAMLADLTPEQRFFTLYQRISAIKDETRRTALAMRAFGEAAVSVLPTLAKGPEYLSKMGKTAESAGVVMSAGDVKTAEAYSRKREELNLRFEGLFVSMGERLIPTLMDLTNSINDHFPRGGWQGLKNSYINSGGKSLFGRLSPAGMLGYASGIKLSAIPDIITEAILGSVGLKYSGVGNRVEAIQSAKTPLPNTTKGLSDREIAYSRQYYMEQAQAEMNKSLFAQMQRGWASNLLDGIEPRNYLQKRMDALFGNEDRENRIDSILGMSPQQRNMFLGMNALSKRKPIYFDADGNVTSRENAASAFVPKQVQDITTRISAMVPQSGTRLLENLGGLGIFSTGDVQKQQLDVQKDMKEYLRQLSTKPKNAASYA